MSAPLCIVLLAACIACILLGCASVTPSDQSKDNNGSEVQKARDKLDIAAPLTRQEKNPLILAHYMPWFEAPPVSRNYGWHWHMGFYDPFEKDSNGFARIASHYYPLTGPYDSQDPDVLEYQASLMKMSGIGGVIIDWYGIENTLDYPRIHQSSKALFAVMKRAGLKFAVCYEDQSVAKAIEAGTLKRADALESGKAAIQWMKDNWFGDDAYLKINGRPVLLNFGPQFFVTPNQWDSLFAGIEPRPLLVTLDNHAESYADATYPWPPMWASSGGILSPGRLVDYLNEYYRKQNANPFMISSAFPGFYDDYAEAHVAPSYGFLDDAGGDVLRLTLDAALMGNADVVQIATWNDYGEGTIVEPTAQKGYRDLEIIQELKRGLDPSFPYSKDDLRIPLKVFGLRIQQSPAADKKAKLDGLFAALATGNIDVFRRLLAELEIGPR
jgi:hypothetical protein